MDSMRAESLFKKSRMISNITIPTKRPIRPNPMLQRQRARRYSREASLLYNATIPDDIKVNLNDSAENDTDAESDAEKDLPFNKVIVQTPVQRNDMSYIISNLGHFQDYRIEVSVGFGFSLHETLVKLKKGENKIKNLLFYFSENWTCVP